MIAAPLFTTFDRCLMTENNLNDGGLARWLFYPGMLFQSMATWWGFPGVRKRPHEGLDLRLFRTMDGRTKKLDGRTRVPAMYDGRVALIIDDFLGRSIFLDHGIQPKARARLFTVLGHTHPLDRIRVDRLVKEGEVIATIADFEARRKQTPPHLHISMGWALEHVRLELLNWDLLSVHPSIWLVDPLAVFSTGYTLDASPLTKRFREFDIGDSDAPSHP